MFEAASSPTTSSAPAPSSTPTSTPAPSSQPAANPSPQAPQSNQATKPTGLDRLRQHQPEPKAEPKVTNPAEPKTPAAGTTSDPAPTPGQTDAVQKPAWTPNWKYKVMDKEHEIPEWMRAAAQSPEHEKSLRELHEKAMGLDVVKPRLVESQQQLKKLMPEYQKLEASRTELVNHYRRGDMDSFLQALGIPEEKMLQWAVKKAQLYQMPPEQRQVHEANSAAERRAYQLEQQLQQANHQNATHATTERQQGLQVELARPDITDFAKRFDEAAGKPQAFIREVIAAGEAAYNRDRTDLTPAQAVQVVMAKYGAFMKGQQPSQVADPGSLPQEGAQEPGLIPPQPAPGAKPQAFATKPTGQQAPTLPNVAAKTGSPVGGPKARSIEDLRRIRKERFGA